LTLGVTDVSEQSVRLDMKMEWILSIVGIPSAFLLHGYGGFIFGSIKANPWWGNVLMPIMFILSAIVSGIALCVFNYIVLTWIRRKTVDMRCLDTMAMFLFYALVVDAVVEGLDVVQKLYSGYGENSGGGMRAGHQDRMFEEGNAYLDREFPKLDKLIRAYIVN